MRAMAPGVSCCAGCWHCLLSMARDIDCWYLWLLLSDIDKQVLLNVVVVEVQWVGLIADNYFQLCCRHATAVG